ncbi:MAG: CotH kinase family protein [Bacillota bacterium]
MTQHRSSCFYNLVRQAALAATLLCAIARAAHAQPAPFAAPTRATDLPMVWLEAKGPFTRDTTAACTMTLASTGQERAAAAELKGVVRLRGSSSLSYPKKSYALCLHKPTGLLDLPAHRHWILNAAFIDRSLIRHKLAYDLFRSLSERGRPRYAASSRFVELNLNGTYQGVYLLMEQVDHELAGLPAYVKQDAAHTAVYKAVNHDAGFDQPGHGGFEQVVPDPALLAYWQPLDDLTQFIHTAPAAQFRNPQNGIAAQLDLDNAIDFHLLILVTANTDGITKNFYLVRPRPSAASPARFFFIPWDFDGVFGQNWDATPLPPELWLSNRLFDRLLEDPDYRDRFAARWQQLRDRQFSTESIHKMIEANVKEIAAAAGRNATRWAATRNRYPNQLTFEQDVARMKTWAAAHLAWLDQTIQDRSKKK